MKKGLIVCLAAIMLTACAETPESILKKEYVKNDDSVSETVSVELIPVDELSDDIDKALSRSYSNFTFGSGVKVELPDEYHECSFTQTANYEENYYDVLSRFFDEETLSMADIVRDEGLETDKMITYSFRDDMQKLYGVVGNNGFICFIKPSAFDNVFDGGNRVKIYHIDRNDDLSDSYDLGGTEVTVAQAAEFAQNWLDENYADLEPDYDICVKTMIARQNEWGVYSFDIHAEEKYKGVILDSLIPMTDPAENQYTKMKYVTREIFMQMFTPDEIGSLTNGNGTIIPQEEKTLDEIISLSSAMGFMESKFTDFNEPMEISDINLKYTLTPIYDYKNNQSCYDAGISFDSRLVWEFAIDIPERDIPSPTAGAMQKYIYIDAQTGELDFEFEASVLNKA